MAHAIDGFFISAGLDDSAFEKGLARMQSSFSSTVKNISNLVSGPLTAAFGAFASGAVVSQYLNQADAIGKMSDSLGVDIEELQAWGEAADRAGGSSQAFQGTLQGLNQRLQEIASGGGGELKKTFETLGISATDSTGKVKSTFQVLSDLAEKSEGLDKQKFVGLAKKMGIDQGTIMLLQSGKIALDDLIKRQKEIGVYTKEDARIAGQANDALADLQQSLKAAAAVILRYIVPPLTMFTNMIREAVVFIKNHQPFFLTAVALIAGAISTSMVPALWRMATAAWAAMAPFLPFIALGAALALVIDDLITYCEGGESAFEALWSTFGTGEDITNNLKAAWKALKDTAETVFEAIKKIVVGFVTNFEVAFRGIGDVVSGILKVIKGLFKGDIDEIYDGFVELFKGLGEVIYGTLEGIARSIIDIFKAVVKYLEDLFERAFGKIKKAWNGLKEVFSFASSDEAQAAAEAPEEHVIEPGTIGLTSGVTNKKQEINAQQTNNITINAQTDRPDELAGKTSKEMASSFFPGLATDQMGG